MSDNYPKYELLSTNRGEHCILIKIAEDESWDMFVDRVCFEYGEACQTQMLIDHLNATGYDPVSYVYRDNDDKQ